MKLDHCTLPASDGSVKYRFQTSDNLFIEALSFTYHVPPQIILCLSTQIGCNMGCKFCGTGLQKLIRNLTQEEIVKQALIIIEHHLKGKSPHTIVLAGCGEPLANYDASLGALSDFHKMFEIIRLSLSTVGITKNILRMIKEKRSVGLYLSLHAADDITRKRLMPIAKKNPILPLIAAAEEYANINSHIPGLVRISYLLLPGINDSEEDLSKLISLLQNKNFNVQLRLWNRVSEINFQREPMSVAEVWERKLKQNGINACIRPSVGQEIAGGCGQMIIASSQKKH
jgi:23S rRNA (adenine2503-C2)-methyltransferase